MSEQHDPKMKEGTTVEASLIAQATRMRNVEADVARLRERAVMRDELDSRLRDLDAHDQRNKDLSDARIDQLWDDRSRAKGRRSVIAAGWTMAGAVLALLFTAASRNIDWIKSVLGL
jgi:hypothetical protein